MAERYPTDAVPDRPEIGVSIDGQALERAIVRDVMEVDVHEEINRHARLSLLVQNWDATSDRSATRTKARSRRANPLLCRSATTPS